jgi:hypothetical protein
MKSRHVAGKSALRPRDRAFETALKAENLRLQKQLAKVRAQNVSLANRITVLQEALKDEKSCPKVRDLMVEIAKRGRTQPNPASNADARPKAHARRSHPR